MPGAHVWTRSEPVRTSEDPFVRCTVCEKPKAPWGRDVAAAVASDFCEAPDCPGYMKDPHPGFKWPGEDAAEE